MPDQPNVYYATFMQKQAFKGKYVTILADTIGDARECMFAHFGEKFMTVYPSEKFKNQPDDYNLTPLCEIKVIDHGHNNMEYILL